MSGCYGEIRGYLFKDAEAKTSKAGGRYASATVKVLDNGQNFFWRVMAFKDHTDELLAFKDGDGVSVKGFVKAEVWTPQGKEPRASLSLMANEIAAWQPGKAASSQGQRKPYSRPLEAQAANGGGRSFPQRSGAVRYADELSDDIPL
jgi:single-stranded DNA-binding protein